MNNDNSPFNLSIYLDPPTGEHRLEVHLVSAKGRDALLCVVDMTSKVIPLGMPAEDFIISAMKICEHWKSGTYDSPGTLDGYALMLSIKSDGKSVHLMGSNYLPENFDALLAFLHEKCHIPVSSIEEML